MRAVILAAGRGSRMGELCDERPKCLVELAKKPLIKRQIAALRAGGVQAIGVVRGYRAHMIELPDLTYFDNLRWSETNMVMSLKAAAQWLKTGPVIVSYADIFYRHEIVRDLVASTGDLVIAYDRCVANALESAVCRPANRRRNISDGCFRPPGRNRKQN